MLGGAPCAPGAWRAGRPPSGAPADGAIPDRRHLGRRPPLPGFAAPTRRPLFTSRKARAQRASSRAASGALGDGRPLNR